MFQAQLTHTFLIDSCLHSLKAIWTHALSLALDSVSSPNNPSPTTTQTHLSSSMTDSFLDIENPHVYLWRKSCYIWGKRAVAAAGTHSLLYLSQEMGGVLLREAVEKSTVVVNAPSWFGD